MNSLSRHQKKYNRLYRSPKDNSYTHKFFQDISTGFSYFLGADTEKNNFFTFEPKECEAARLINDGCNYSYEIEQTITRAAHSLVVYGKAFIYLKSEYAMPEEKAMSDKKNISSLRVYEIKGFVLKRHRNKLVFYCGEFDSAAEKIEMFNDELIILRLKDLGFCKNYFTKMVKKLGKADVLSSSLMMTKNVDGYDFFAHSKKQKLYELKLTKDLGWFSRVDILSDSYILYKRIQLNKLKLKLLNYIVEKINEGISAYLKRDDAGKLVAHTKKINYDQLWTDFVSGQITVTELSALI